MTCLKAKIWNIVFDQDIGTNFHQHPMGHVNFWDISKIASVTTESTKKSGYGGGNILTR